MQRRLTLNIQSTQLVFSFFYLVLMLPFVVCDFYYAHKDFSCVWIYSTIWMMVDGSVSVSLVTLMLVISIIYMPTPSCKYLNYAFVLLCLGNGLFRVAWLIVGSVLFWGDLQNRNLCAQSVRKFMQANLIAGYLYTVLYFAVGCLFPQPTVRVPRKIIQEIRLRQSGRFKRGRLKWFH